MADVEERVASSVSSLPMKMRTGLLSCLLLAGCDVAGGSFLAPEGPVAAEQLKQFWLVIAFTGLAVVPVLVLVPMILWRYREHGGRGQYNPDWDKSARLDFLMWGLPFVIIVALSFLLWQNTAKLDPYRQIPSEHQAIRVQVIGLDWKWLFIYPDEGVATINELAFVEGVPLSLELTSDTVMQSFVVAALGGQIYAMPGMRTQLNVLATSAGVYEGENMQFSGEGFHEQKFDAIALSDSEFRDWLQNVKRTGSPLTAEAYNLIAERGSLAQAAEALGVPTDTFGMQGEKPALYFVLGTEDPFDLALQRYRSGQAVSAEEQPGSPSFTTAAGRAQ